uniref:Uncharacterized protein n=1 Tax=Triticum urartu TaxID=4572 RepID=A0A8R7U8U4_TRIUA
MDRRQATTCILLLIVLLGNFASAADDDYCWEEYNDSALCFGFVCKAECWMNSKLEYAGTKPTVKGYKCTGSKLKHRCHCYYCVPWSN